MKKIDFNVIKFLVIFFFLLEGFYFYVGITTEGGKLFSSFLSKYINIPNWLTILVAGSAKALLEICGYEVYQKDAANITIAGSRGVTLAWACLGAGAISLWVAFIAAHRCEIKYKLKWIVAGVIFIFIINTLRIILIALSNYYNWIYLKHFNAHTSFNIITYAIILFLMLIFVRNYNGLKQNVTILNV